ncbi:ProQ/FINO family protein [Ideonella alba]|uniref:ProQ/FINO family protein n=1 Tax=Ideonella alba TaxID=2824118 RepID=UPI001FFC860D|nr:ProQ/FinO family protein [Ideonella alba]
MSTEQPQPGDSASPVEPPAAVTPAEAVHEAVHENVSEAASAVLTEAVAAPAPQAPKAPEMSLNACTRELRQRFPALFGEQPKPIKLRIQADIQQRAPGVFTKKALSIFLHRHTTHTSYLLALAKATHRYDLDGQPAGELAEEHRQAARDELARRKAIVQERRAAEDDARRQRFSLVRDYEHTTLTKANFCALKGIAEDQLDGLLATIRAEIAAWEAQRPAAPPRPERRDGRDERRGPRGDARGEARGGPRGGSRGPGGPGGRGPRP